MLLKLLLAVMLAVPLGQGGQDRSGSGAPPMVGDPTPFEQFVDKLNLDTKQLQDVHKIFNDAAAEASPVSQSMIQVRQRLLAMDPAAKPEEITPVLDAYTAAATKMAGIEVRAVQKVLDELRPNQKSKAADAFVLIAGLFNPLTPRPGQGRPRGGGGQ